MSELYLVRHAQASFGGENYDELSALGYRQSEWLGQYFTERGIRFNHMVTGNMQRHWQTLDGICKGSGLADTPAYDRYPGLDEYNFMVLSNAYGNQHPEDELYLETLKYPGDKKLYYRLLRRVLTAWSKGQIKGVEESWQTFQQRVAAAKQLMQNMVKPGECILVVSSGGAISMLIGLVLNLPAEAICELNLQMKNTGISHFFFNNEKMMLSGFNSVPHLDQPQRIQKITYG